MDKKLLVQVGVEVFATLIRGGLELFRTLGVSNEELDKAFKAAKVEFENNDPSNIKFN